MNQDRTLRTLALAAFCMMIGVGAIVSILPSRIIALSGATASLGMLSTSFAVAYVAAQLPVGYLADRFGVRAFLAGGYMICAAAGLIFFIAPNAGIIFLGRFIQGIGEAPVWALGPALLSVRMPIDAARPWANTTPPSTSVSPSGPSSAISPGATSPLLSTA